ncbi:MAG: hypothetical protein O2923_08160 [Verrucomicrobia bacterium]|nr:hypothetical protein [Verrucomicrobiota bacterium]MDA1088095.1 hypothetical protein [Verrucomicrobiota bacterium]
MITSRELRVLLAVLTVGIVTSLAAQEPPAAPGAGVADVNPDAEATAPAADRGSTSFDEDLEGVGEAVRNDDNLISITVDSVPLEDVVRMFTKLSDANIVATTSNLEGSVTVSLTDVEWRPALSSILEMHGLVLVEKTPGSGIWSIVAQDPNAGPPMIVQVIRLKFATVGDVAPIVQTMLGEGGGSVSEFASRNTVIVRASAESIEQINTLITEIDLARDQVYIESKFVELNHGASKSIGVDWQMLEAYTLSATLGAGYADERVTETTQNDALNRFDRRATANDTTKNFDARDGQIDDSTLDFIESPPDSGNFIETRTITPTRTFTELLENGSDVTRDLGENVTRTVTELRTAVLSPQDLRVVLSALQELSGVAVVSNPKIIVANEQQAEIHIGEKEPNIRGTVTAGQQGQANTTTFTLDPDQPYFNFGIELLVTPTVNTESNITVLIAPTLTRFIRNKIAPDGNSFPITSEKTIRTLFNLANGKTAAIGGLTETTERDVVRGIPLLGDIPLLGKYLFSHSSKQEQQQETIIFVTVGLANPGMMDSDVGIPEYTEETQKHLIRRSLRQRQANEELERMKAAAMSPDAKAHKSLLNKLRKN